MEQSQETPFSFKGVSRRTILKILGASGAAIASYLVAPAAWSKPNISAITSLLLGDAADSLTDDIELKTTQDEQAECHDYSTSGDSCSLLPLGAVAAAGGSAVVDNQAGDTPTVWCSNNWTTSFRSKFPLNITSNWNSSGVSITGPWDFTWYRSADNLFESMYPAYWKPLGSNLTMNLTQTCSGGVCQGSFREYNSVLPNATSYYTQIKHAKYSPSTMNLTYYYSKNCTTSIRYNMSFR